MPKKIQISRQGTVWLPHMQSYKLIVSAINAEGMPAEIFVKQRLKNFVHDNFTDNFVAVATPTQLEDFPVNAPDSDSSFYRVSQIELVGRLPENLDAVFDTLIYEVQKLVEDLNSLDYLEQARVYNIEAGNTELIPGPPPTPTPLNSNKIRIGTNGYLETLIGTEWKPAAVTIYVNNVTSLPTTGSSYFLYVILNTNKIYRWNSANSQYVELSQSAGGTDIYNAAVEWTPNHTLADGTRYLAGDMVYYGGKIYRAKFDNESMPVSNVTYWEDLGPGYRLNIDGRDIQNIPASPAIQTAIQNALTGKVSSNTAGIAGATPITNIVGISQNDYNSLVSGGLLDPNTLYFITS